MFKRRYLQKRTFRIALHFTESIYLSNRRYFRHNEYNLTRRKLSYFKTTTLDIPNTVPLVFHFIICDILIIIPLFPISSFFFFSESFFNRAFHLSDTYCSNSTFNFKNSSEIFFSSY